MKTRNYTKLFVNKNREEGSDKISLGYQTNTTDIVLKKDELTYFHIPAKTTPISIHASGLIQAGATGGSFPAASDRIFKSRLNYANVTPHGDPTEVPDGTWYCSWLYKSPGGFLQWMDRIYNPGYMYNPQLALTGVYVNNDPLIKDVPSIMVFEPGLLYKYYHVGEKSVKTIVESFGGVEKEKLVLDLSNAEQPLGAKGVLIPDQPKIFTTATTQQLYDTSKDADRPVKTGFNFNNDQSIEIFLDHNDSYIPNNEFTLSFWAQSPDWNMAPTTQLAGNYSSKGGVGVFIENIETHPFFVIPETNYGHVLYINENLNGFLDKSVQEIPKKATSSAFTAIDFDHNVVVCIDDPTGTVYKIDNAGQIIASTKQTEIPFTFVYPNETPIELLIGENNNVIIRTQRGIYTLDSQLNKTTQLMLSSSSKDVCSYSYDVQTNRAELILTKNSLDSKFLGTTQWSISADGNLYKTSPGVAPELFYEFKDRATNLAIDPSENLWVLHGTNKVSIIINPMASTPLEVTPIRRQAGKDVEHLNKNLNFIYTYDRKTKTRTWYGVIYYSNEEYIYILDSEGNSKKVLDIYSLFDSNLVTALEQNYENFKFLGKGDFTGYEHRRVFRQLAPYNNQTQLALRISLKDRAKQILSFNQFVVKTPINWNNNSWQHFALTMKQQAFSLYVNGILQTTFTYSGKHQLSYELGPSFYIGSPGGSQSGYNKEIQNQSQLFNGLISDIKLYDYCIDAKNLESYLREFITADDLTWSMPIPSLEYIEKIERVFQNKIPGAKSPTFKVKIRGSGIKDEHTKNIVQQQIHDIVDNMQPAYTDFLKIDWIE